MRLKGTLAATCAVLATPVALDAYSGTVDTRLAATVAGLAPQEMVNVIVRCATDPGRAAEPVATPASDRRTRRTTLVKALRERGAVCRRLLAEGLALAQGEAEADLWLANAIALRVRADRVAPLVRQPGVERIYLNERIELPPGPRAPVPAGPTVQAGFAFWNLSDTRITDLWALGYDGQGTVVATLDTGVDPLHADLGSRWRGGTNSWYDPNGEHAAPFDADGHGTGVMGLVLGGGSLGVDIGAAPGARWIAAKVFDDSGATTLAKIHLTFQWLLDPDGDPATDDAPDIANNSWALPDPNLCSGEFAGDIAALRTADIAVVFSAGNFGPDAGTSVAPANDPGSLSVGALDYYGDVSLTSSRGPSACGGGIYPRLAAPGEDIFTTALTGGGANPNATAYYSGTSFAAPHVAGTLALLKGAFPDLPMPDLERAIETGAQDLGTPGPDNDSGAGYLDAAAAYLVLDAQPADLDGDGFASDLDCDDGDPGRYPGAPEIVRDGIDQDCNGLDLTIRILKARYDRTKGQLTLAATSALASAAQLRATLRLKNGTDIDRALVWKGKTGRWELTLKDVSRRHGSRPQRVTVYGPEGAVTAPVAQAR